MTLIQAQDRRLVSPSAAPTLLLKHPQAALAPRSKRFKTISSSHRSSDNSTSTAAANATTTTPSVAASLRRVLNLPPKNGSSSSHSITQGADQRYRVFLDQWDKGFMEAQENPKGYFADTIYGEIPRELEGTLFRNGPGKFTLGGKRIPHPYDGDGLVASIAFKNGTAFFRSRFVQTPEYKAEAAADSVLFRGTFATQRSGGAMANAGDLYVKNTSNTNVVAYGDRLWTLFEAGQPFRLNPKTLDTIGPELLDGLFKAGLPFDLGSKESNSMFAAFTRLAQGRAAPAASAALSDEQISAGGTAVTAHPHICPSTGRLVTFSYRVRPIVPSSPNEAPFVTDITFYELENDAENTGKMRSAATREYTLPGFAFLHDFALTENYYVIFQNPVTVENAPYMLGQAPAVSCVRWVKDTPTFVHVIPRNRANSTMNNPTNTRSDGRSSDDVMVFSAPPLFVFHHANAFEKKTSAFTTSNNTASTTTSTSSTCADTSTTLIIDSIHYNSLPAVGREALSHQSVDPDAAFTSRLRRVEIDLKSKILKVRCAFDGYLEMPAVNPNFLSKKHQFVYGYHSIFEDPQIALAKVDVEGRKVELWNPGKNRFALEPRFIPRNRGRNKGKNSNNNSTAGKAGGGGSARGVFNTSNNNKSAEEVEVEDDGWLIAQLFDSEAMRSEIVILDAQNLSQGPVAIVALNELMPSALHACWSDTYYSPVNDDTSNSDAGSESSLHESKAGNVVPFGSPVSVKAERNKLKGSGSVRKSMPTGSSKSENTICNSNNSEYSEEIGSKNGTGLKEFSSKMQSVAIVLGALWSNFTEI
ncbi:hypothetical protein Ndes2526B_g08043 [Nannochloris sp. 'desiccata']|nr:hypothetical protein KSW81_002686 [Chlorella desiccata (nom. nud.)]